MLCAIDEVTWVVGWRGGGVSLPGEQALVCPVGREVGGEENTDTEFQKSVDRGPDIR